MPTKCFKMGGLFFLFFSLNLSAQITDPCATGFEFEVVKIVPDPSSPQTPAFSQNSNPSMLHIYYKVRLKSTNGQPLPASLSYTYLSFNGKIGVNNHSSKIDVKLSKQFSNTLNPLFPQIANALSVSEDGEVDWSFGETYSGCTGSEMPATVNLPPGASIDLFIIVVQAAPGETICWVEGPAAELQDCLSIPPCSGTIPVSHSGTLCHTFEYPQNCSPSVYLSFESVQGNAPPATLIEVYLDNLQVGKPLTHIDGHLRLEPNMIGGEIVEFSIPVLNGPGITLDPVKNPDGSLDLYYYFDDSANPFTPTQSKERIFGVVVSRYNYSLGGEILAIPNYTRIIRGTGLPSPPYELCNVVGVPATINIPGYDPCGADLKVTAQQIIDYNDDCAWKLRFTINHSKGGPFDLNGIKLEYWFVTSPGNLPLSPITDLPCPGCISLTQTTINSGNNLLVKLVYEDTQPLQLIDGSYIELEFSNYEKCVQWYIIGAEATWPDDSKCGLYPVREADFPACRPVLKGFVFLPYSNTGDNRVIYNKVTLFNPTTQTDLAETDDDCLDFFQFCRAPAEGPFSVRVETTQANGHCACGVTTYDMVLINKYILGYITLPWYGKIAGNVSLTTDQNGDQVLSTLDIIEIRKCILGLQNNFGQHSAPSWWYIIDGHTVMNDPFNKAFFPYTSVGTHISPIAPGTNPQFWAIKTGDVNTNCICTPNNLSDASSRAQDAAKYRIDFAQAKRSGRELLLPVYYDGSFQAIALQGGFRFDAVQGRLAEVVPNVDAGISMDCFGLSEIGSGALRFAWYSERPEQLLPSGTLLFTLRFDLQDEAQLPDIWGSENVLAPLVYSTNGTEVPVTTQSNSNKQRVQQLGLIVNPNPVAGKTTLYIHTAAAGKAQLLVTNAAGQLVYSQSVELKTGEQTLDWDTAALAPGLYYLQLNQNSQRVSAKALKY